MAATGARMLSVEEASRYAGGLDDPARLVSSFAGVAANLSSNGISIHGNAPHLLQWRMEDVEIRTRTTLPIYPYWAAVSYHHSAARFWVIPTSSQVPFPPNTGMPFPVYST